MRRFIARENITHFRALLESEVDPSKRLTLRTLLLQEEDKFGADCESLNDVERHIADGKGRIERQRVLIADLERNGRNGVAQARVILEILMDSQTLLCAYRERILTKLNNGPL